VQHDSERKAAFEVELADIQTDLQRLRLHAHVSERFQDVRDDIQVNVLGVLSAMLDLIGKQLSHLKRFRAGFQPFDHANVIQCELLR
jgi:hypothetical protein